LPGVITFHPHPRTVLNPEEPVSYLLPLEERKLLLNEAGADLLAVVTFTPETARMGAEGFILLLYKYLKMRGLVVGPGFGLGRNREGDAVFLRRLGEEKGFFVEEVEPLLLEGQPVSSTAVRQALAEGDMKKAAQLLGRKPSLKGPVVRGAERGGKLGFPTANMGLNSHQALPGDGVYVTLAQVGGQSHFSVTNIGRRPTFDDGPRLVEVHLLDFDGDLYGQELKLELVERLRPELRFDSVDALIAQMHRDVAQARLILGEMKKTS
jgi:riboflavin kinase/FMN adenylyltransferase